MNNSLKDEKSEEDLRAELEKALAKAEEYESKYKYLLADYDNYRKGIERHAENRIKEEKAKLILKLINLKDDYIRAIDAIKGNSKEHAIIEGLEGVLKNLDKILQEEGVEEIEALGKAFDPNLHEVISFIESDLPEHTVTREFRKGYMLYGKVIRPTSVEISRLKDVNKGHTNVGNLNIDNQERE